MAGAGTGQEEGLRLEMLGASKTLKFSAEVGRNCWPLRERARSSSEPSAIADALEVDVSLIADVQSTPDEDWTFAYDASLATARFGVLEVRKSVLERLVETCVATDAEACSSVLLDGTTATCTGAGACSYTPATTQAMCQAYTRVQN